MTTGDLLAGVLPPPLVPPAPERHTERSMIDRLHARYSKRYRNGTYEAPQYVRADHVANSAGFNYGGERIADYIAIDTFVPREHTPSERERMTWKGRNGSIHGHEIKVSRSDWLTELADPTKAEAWMRHCHYWWLVAPKEIVRDDLPEGWGLLVPWRDSLRIAVRAPRRDPEPMPVTMLASLARRIRLTEVNLANGDTP